MIHSWSRGGIVGRGGYGTVFVCMDDETGALFTMKEVVCTDNHRAAELENEISVLSTLSHGNIVKYLGAHRDGQRMNIFMEYVSGGSLASILRTFNAIKEPAARRYTRQVLCGLEYIHGAGFVHRDVKSANILVTVDGIVKLCDFGTALQLNHPMQFQPEAVCIGTPGRVAPERLRCRLVGPLSDIYATGCVVLEMLIGTIPVSSTVVSPVNGGRSPIIPTSISHSAQKFIQLCFADYRSRPSATDLLQHSFIVVLNPSTTAANTVIAAPAISISGPEPQTITIQQSAQQTQTQPLSSVIPVVSCGGGDNFHIRGGEVDCANVMLMVRQYQPVTVSMDLSSDGTLHSASCSAAAVDGNDQIITDRVLSMSSQRSTRDVSDDSAQNTGDAVSEIEGDEITNQSVTREVAPISSASNDNTTTVTEISEPLSTTVLLSTTENVEGTIEEEMSTSESFMEETAESHAANVLIPCLAPQTRTISDCHHHQLQHQPIDPNFPVAEVAQFGNLVVEADFRHEDFPNNEAITGVVADPTSPLRENEAIHNDIEDDASFLSITRGMIGGLFNTQTPCDGSLILIALFSRMTALCCDYFGRPFTATWVLSMQAASLIILAIAILLGIRTYSHWTSFADPVDEPIIDASDEEKEEDERVLRRGVARNDATMADENEQQQQHGVGDDGGAEIGLPCRNLQQSLAVALDRINAIRIFTH